MKPTFRIIAKLVIDKIDTGNTEFIIKKKYLAI